MVKKLCWRVGFGTRGFMFIFSTLSWGSDLTDAAQKADAYWGERYTSCTHPRFGDVWYMNSEESAIVAGLIGGINFQTIELTAIDLANGVEFKALSSIRYSLSRLWTSSSGWEDWHRFVDSNPITLVKRNEAWAITGGFKRFPKKPQCAEIPK